MGRCAANKLGIDGAKLTAARLRRNMSMDELCAEMEKRGEHVHRSSVSRWERGFFQPGDKRVIMLSEILNSADFIRGNEVFGKKSRKKREG